MLNPVCVLTTLHSRNQRNPVVLHDNIKVWLEKGLVSSIRSTSTKQCTSSPVWKESFKMYVLHQIYIRDNRSVHFRISHAHDVVL